MLTESAGRGRTAAQLSLRHRRRELVDFPPQGNETWSGDNPDPATSRAPWRVYNIGNHTPVELMEVVRLLEQALGKTAIKELMPMQPGDAQATFADVDALQKAVRSAPNTPIADGIRRFIDWFRHYCLKS